MTQSLAFALLFFVAVTARGQIRVDLKFKRLQYIAYEPVLATVTVTNLAGREVELHDGEEPWFGFEVNAKDGRTLAPLPHSPEPPLRLAAGATVTRKINLTSLFPIADLGVYHVRANVYFADLNKFFYARAKVFEVTSARPVWRQTVGDPASHGARTYSLMTNRFPDHTSLYVRVEDKESSLVYATYSLGRIIAFDEPLVEVDRKNRLHVLQCSAPRMWSYSVIDLDGDLVKHASYAQTRSSPRLRRAADGTIAVAGGMLDTPATATAAGKTVPKFFDRPSNLPSED